jgi:hypothetical protein
VLCNILLVCLCDGPGTCLMELFDQYNNIHCYSLFSICSVVLFACAMVGPMDPGLYYINVVIESDISSYTFEVVTWASVHDLIYHFRPLSTCIRQHCIVPDVPTEYS